MKDLGLLTLRLTAGGLLAGHGLQKLTGAFNGPGREGTAGFMESLGLQPGKYWGLAAGLAETSGALMALGFLEPLGEIGAISSMAMATGRVHWGKPIWVTAGGAELPVINSSIAATLMLTGPGRISLDSLLGIRLPRTFVALTMAGAAAALAYGLTRPKPAAPEQQQAATQPQGGEQTNGLTAAQGEGEGQRQPFNADEPLAQDEAESAQAHRPELRTL